MKTLNSTKGKNRFLIVFELLIYRLAVELYVLMIIIAAVISFKAKLWFKGRLNWRKKIITALKKFPENSEIIWFHCASLGEFEQGRPLIEAIKNKNPGIKILLSFFSPSGYEIRRNYPLADYVCYLPADRPSNAKDWLDIIKPTAVFFIKYEFWYYFLHETHRRSIPLYLVSATFRPGQLFFNKSLGMFAEMLSFFSKIFVQDEASMHLLERNGFLNAVRSGDTRIDSALHVKAIKKDFPLIEKFKNDARVLVCGSTWPADEKIILTAFNSLKNKNLKLIIAPHEIEKSKILSLFSKCTKVSSTILYSEALKTEDYNSLNGYNILIIDNIGMLSQIYRFGMVAYVGGGFGTGIHNILEAAVYNIPVIFGPENKKFNEAKKLLSLGTAFEIKNAEELNERLCNIDFESIIEKSNTFFDNEKGATQKILREYM